MAELSGLLGRRHAHTPRASDSEKVFGGGGNDTEAGGVPCREGLLQMHNLPAWASLTYTVWQKSFMLTLGTLSQTLHPKCC